jgi:hypothetical protein
VTLTGAEAIIACEQVVLTFSACFDNSDGAGMLELFADDGLWKRQDGDIHGVDELRAFMERRPAGIRVRHVLSNLRTTLPSDTEARVDSYVTVYRAENHHAAGPASFDGPELVGRYRDILTRKSDGWQLASREVIVDFKVTKTVDAPWA